MNDVQEELLSYDVNSSNIRKTVKNIRIFFIWVFFTCICDAFIYLYLFKTHTDLLTSWFAVTVVFILFICIFLTCMLYQKNKQSFKHIHVFFQFFSLILGTLFGIGIYIINLELTRLPDTLNPFYSFLLSSFLLSFSYVMAMNFLNQRFSYFTALFVPSSIPVFSIPLLFPQNTNEVYSTVFIVWFALLFFSAYISHKIYLNSEILNLKNRILIRQSQQQLEESKGLQLQLKNEISKTQTMKNELQLHNHLLEQKVKERTYDFKQMNDRLENHQANLTFAHETAGIHSWVWNIEKRTFEIADSKSDAEFRQLNLKQNNVDDFIHPEDIENYKTLLKQHLKGKTERFEAIYRVKRDNQWCWIQDIGKVVSKNFNNKPLRMVGIQRNIQKEKTDQEKLKLAANVLEQVAEGVFILDNNLCYLEVNPYFEQLLAYKENDLIGRHLFDITINNNTRTEKMYTVITQSLVQHGEFESELQIDFTSGKKLVLWVHINAIYDEKNKISNYVGIITDLTDRKKQEQRLSYLEHYDILTDLPNRFYFKQRLHHYLTHYSSTFKNFAVLRINIDRFKLFNEFMSHKEGDELLKRVAHRLRLCCSSASLIAYLNNDDFAVIYNLNSNINIHQHAQNILDAFKQPFDINAQEQTITLSIGIALYPEHGLQLDSLNGHAESALREAKRLGGNTVYFYSDKKTPLLNQGINLESELRKAIKHKELTVHYQPKICVKTQRIYGFEALVRWQHPTLGYILPDIFIPLAEETSLISDIGLIVLHETCKQIQYWQSLGFDHFRVSINIVAQQIYRGQLIEDIDYALKKYNISGDMLELELTESSLFEKSDQVNLLLKQLKDRHISISLDDFGTGYSSLAYLTSYPFDILKIDKAFISKIGQEKDEAIVNAIIAMGNAIGITLVAEGVETKEQALFLEKHGCYILQGFYFSKALSSADSTKYLEQHKLITIC
ncbi:EAL domain-containing protein [Acinetobacter nematophilus]|uniref:sensor domain-containing protein n=1 Tax=Acinetobacter nematophilus TaxID=2994642 RepID=UPI003AF9E9E7